jgi:putative thiamine transport system permease protein
MIALSDPWRRLDRRHAATAAALGAGPWRRLVRVKLPLLLQPILTAAAIGFAVSVAQYLPTLFIGAGRVATLTTEAVALSSGADRRIAGLYGLLQAALPWAVYTLAILLPLWLWRDRQGLRGGQPG